MIERTGIIVYFNSNKVIQEIQKIEAIDIVYENTKANYLVGYLDKSLYQKISKQIINMKHVKKVEPSLLEMTSFQE